MRGQELVEKMRTEVDRSGFDHTVPVPVLAEAMRHAYANGADAGLCASVGSSLAEAVVSRAPHARVMRPVWDALEKQVTSAVRAQVLVGGEEKTA